VLEIFRRIADQHLTTLIVVTHSVEVAETADRRIHLRSGKIVELGGDVSAQVETYRRRGVGVYGRGSEDFPS
jgi:ABC-type lipoprotein export system ATPase subunit